MAGEFLWPCLAAQVNFLDTILMSNSIIPIQEYNKFLKIPYKLTERKKSYNNFVNI